MQDNSALGDANITQGGNVANSTMHAHPSALAAALPSVMTGQELCSDLLLQQLLYYNLFAAPVWLLTVGVRTHLKARSATRRAAPSGSLTAAWWQIDTAEICAQHAT